MVLIYENYEIYGPVEALSLGLIAAIVPKERARYGRSLCV